MKRRSFYRKPSSYITTNKVNIELGDILFPGQLDDYIADNIDDSDSGNCLAMKHLIRWIYESVTNTTDISSEDEKINILLGNKDKIKYKVILPQKLSAPIKENEIVGLCKAYLNNELYKIYTIKTIDSVNIIDYRWHLENICEQFCFSREIDI